MNNNVLDFSSAFSMWMEEVVCQSIPLCGFLNAIIVG